LKTVLASVRADLAARRTTWNNKRRAEMSLTQDWAERTAIERRYTSDGHAISQLSDKLTERSNAQREMSVVLKGVLGHIQTRQQLIREITQRRQTLESAANYAAVYLNKFDPEKKAPPTLRNLLDVLDTEGSQAARSRKSATLTELLAELPERQQQLRERPELLKQQKAIEADLLTDESLQKLLEQEKVARALAHEAVSQYEAISGPLEMLRHLAQQYLQTAAHDENCPVCNHHWPSAEALRQAVNSSLGPNENLSLLQNRAGERQAELAKFEKQRMNQATLRKRGQALSDTIRHSESVETAFLARASEAGLEPIIENLQHGINVAASRLALADAVSKLRNELVSLELAADIKIPRTIELDMIHVISKELTEAPLAAFTKGLAESEGERDRLQVSLRTTNEEMATFEKNRQELKSRFTNDASILDRLRSAWLSLAGDLDWTEEAFEKVTGDLRREFEALEKVSSRIDQATSFIDLALRKDELNILEVELAALKAEHDRLIRLSEAAASIRSAYKERRQKHVREQLSSIVRVISALFSRMQANEVFDKVIEGDESTPLSWRVVADELSIDPERKFSQGQRQDFALSIFLSRARSIGGTFFMDEPMLHLDDLNRVALLDVFRAIIAEDRKRLSLVITTSSRPLTRHIAEKFHNLARSSDEKSLLNIIELKGTPRTGVRAEVRSLG
jgi:DNA repair protein SbcC/Rad50